MSAVDDHEDLKPTETPGYKPSAAKTVEEYANLDAEDPSLARWKASLGIITVQYLQLMSPTLPPGKTITLDAKSVVETKKNPIHIKEGVEYNVRIGFKANHSIVTGLRYIQLVKRSGIKVDKLEQMLGSYGPREEPYTKDFDPAESPSGLLARQGTYGVRSRVLDDDGEIYLDWEWSFKLAKEW
ncbi:immunoglobulin E-set [Amanita rubescens]|nr:immunoglobulin E-set [Amanita rubescens]